MNNYQSINHSDDSKSDDKNYKEIRFSQPDDIEYEAKIISIKALKKSRKKQFAYYFLSLITCGIFYLFCRWKKKLEIFMKYNKVSLEEADSLEIEDPGLNSS